MALPDDIRVLTDRILVGLDEARDFYRHSRQAWRLVYEDVVEAMADAAIRRSSGIRSG